MPRSEAPYLLEHVRSFLNTWRIPNDVRIAVDDLPVLVADQAAWRAQMPDLPPPRSTELADLDELRTDLRAALGMTHPTALRGWLDRLPLTVLLAEERLPVRHVPLQRSAAGFLLATVVDAVAEGVWARLKACPDCQWVFYDHSRNGTRRWCGMYAESDRGRACGSIAKVRTYRARQSRDTGRAGSSGSATPPADSST